VESVLQCSTTPERCRRDAVRDLDDGQRAEQDEDRSGLTAGHGAISGGASSSAPAEGTEAVPSTTTCGSGSSGLVNAATAPKMAAIRAMMAAC